MIRRECDPEVVNKLAGGLDFSEVLSEPLHICLIEGENGAIFAWRGPGTYEAHVFFSVRGRDALELGWRMLAHMREHHGAQKFWTLVPVESRHVKMFARLLGWESKGEVISKHGAHELFVLEKLKCPQSS